VELDSGETLRGALVVGADGARSRVAAQLGVRPPNYAGYSAYRGVATFQRGGLPLPLNTIRQVRALCRALQFLYRGRCMVVTKTSMRPHAAAAAAEMQRLQ